MRGHPTPRPVRFPITHQPQSSPTKAEVSRNQRVCVPSGRAGMKRCAASAATRAKATAAESFEAVGIGRPYGRVTVICVTSQFPPPKAPAQEVR